MNEKQTIETGNYDLDHFTVYRDGQIDRSWQRRQQLRNAISVVAGAAYTGLEVVVNGLDEMVQAVNQTKI